MLKFDSITLRRGADALLKDTSALIHTGQRLAIVGANGAGKTSLFKLILGELSVDAGNFSLPGNCRVSHMAQEVAHIERGACDYVIDGHLELRALQGQLAQAELDDDHNVIAHVHGELENIHAYAVPAEAEKLLHGLGFSQSDMLKPVSDFSGGWRIRLNLAQALMRPSDLLLLDEPTNHLDLDAMLWLENWLKQYRGTLLFISHDRDFIDAVASHILHFEHAALNQYTGSYSAFERQRAEKLAQQQSQYEKQQQRIGEIQSFVSRFKAKATKAKQAQSRVKELERMELIAPAHIDSPFNFSFPASDQVSSPLLNLSACQLGYPNATPVIPKFSTSILPGTRVGLLGPNGAGKSTLVKSLVGDLDLLGGSRVEGEHLRIGYFAQHQLEALDYGASPFLHLQRLKPSANDQEIRSFLGGFDFRGDKALETIERFSGGEKARLALAMIAFGRPNLLLLDEPTNHLDLEMRHALTVALQSFEGAVIVVSHDRHLLKNTVDEFWLVAEGKVELFKGDLADYEKWLVDYQRGLSAPSAGGAEGVASGEDKKERKRREAEARKRLSPLKNELKKVEQSMQRVQKTLAEIEAALGDNDLYSDANKDKLKNTFSRQAEAKNELDSLELNWFELSEQIEELEPLDS
jgi:ATP-binding cassette subfamily F protein 3